MRSSAAISSAPGSENKQTQDLKPKLNTVTPPSRKSPQKAAAELPNQLTNQPTKQVTARPPDSFALATVRLCVSCGLLVACKSALRTSLRTTSHICLHRRPPREGCSKRFRFTCLVISEYLPLNCPLATLVFGGCTADRSRVGLQPSAQRCAAHPWRFRACDESRQLRKSRSAHNMQQMQHALSPGAGSYIHAAGAKDNLPRTSAHPFRSRSSLLALRLT